jgi:hypothetical protein
MATDDEEPFVYVVDHEPSWWFLLQTHGHLVTEAVRRWRSSIGG